MSFASEMVFASTKFGLLFVVMTSALASAVFNNEGGMGESNEAKNIEYVFFSKTALIIEYISLPV